MRHIYIQQLKLGPGEADSINIADALQYGLLVDPAQLNVVLTSLHCLAGDLLAERGSASRTKLRERLQSESVALLDSVNYRLDFDRLDNLSATNISSQVAEGRSSLSVGKYKLSVSRSVVQEMFRAVQQNSFLVTGGAGTGKTGCLLALAEQLRSSGFRVWYWTADSLPYHSYHEIITHLQLQHPWPSILAEVASGSGAIIIIDGLDGLRDTKIQNGYRELIALSIRCGVKVVASIRSFDLQYADDLQETFPAVTESLVSAQFLNSDFKKVSHVVVPELDDLEFNQVLDRIPMVKAVLEEANQLLPIVHNMFNLELIVQTDFSRRFSYPTFSANNSS